MSSFGRVLLTGFLLAAAAGAPAQLVPQVSVPNVGLPGGIGTGTVGDVVNTTGQTVGRTVGTANQVTRADVEREIAPSLDRLTRDDWMLTAPERTMAELRRLRLAELVKQNRNLLEMDGVGNPARRGRLIAVDPQPAALSLAVRAGFTIAADERDEVLGIRSVAFNIPRGMRIAQAMQALRRAAPALTVDFDHVFEPAGGSLAASNVTLAASTAVSAQSGRPLIGMVDGGVARSPALSSATIEQRGFAGAAQPTGHGTAIASLIVGSDGKFRGAASGAALLVGDVYGGSPAAGSATTIVKALSWIASHRPGVVNISLIGPRNRLVERAVGALQARGIKVVAAVGNDGPAAPPQYPASYPGVIAVTGVDARGQALPEAGKAAHLDFAAPGADMAAALPGKGYAKVRGTSFASPLAAARLAMVGSPERLAAEARPGKGRIGRGIVCGNCRVSPRSVGAK